MTGDKTDAMRELGRRYAMERKRRFLDLLLNGETFTDGQGRRIDPQDITDDPPNIIIDGQPYHASEVRIVIDPKGGE